MWMARVMGDILRPLAESRKAFPLLMPVDTLPADAIVVSEPDLW
jgi:hypothetical protein